MAAGGSNKVIIFALSANLGIAIAKFAGAMISGSASLLAEAIHSLADCTNQVFLLIGNRASEKAPTPSHPLGYGRETFFWSFLVAILLFAVGGLFSVYEGIHKLSDTKPIEHPWLGLGILGFGIILESASFYACFKEVRAQNPYPTISEWFRKSTSADLIVIFMEDLAALLGLVFAMVALSIAWLTGNPMWDAAGSITVGALLIAVSWLLARETKSLLIGEAPSLTMEEPINAIVQSRIPGGRILRFIGLQISAKEVMISYKVHPGEIRDVAELVQAINEIEKQVRARFPEVRWQFVEPDDQE